MHPLEILKPSFPLMIQLFNVLLSSSGNWNRQSSKNIAVLPLCESGKTGTMMRLLHEVPSGLMTAFFFTLSCMSENYDCLRAIHLLNQPVFMRGLLCANYRLGKKAEESHKFS